MVGCYLHVRFNNENKTPFVMIDITRAVPCTRPMNRGQWIGDPCLVQLSSAFPSAVINCLLAIPPRNPSSMMLADSNMKGLAVSSRGVRSATGSYCSQPLPRI